MKHPFLTIIVFLFLVAAVNAQVNGYTITKKDTIRLDNISFKKTAALYYNNAIVLIDQKLFTKRLKAIHKGLKKQIKARQRLSGSELDKILNQQAEEYKKRFSVVDSIYINSKRNKADTIYTNGYLFGDIIPLLLENGQSIVLDLNKNRQPFIIKQSGYIKTGAMTATGSSFYYLPGALIHFLAKMDWVS